MCMNARVSVHAMWDGTVTFIQKVLNKKALELKSIAGLNRREASITDFYVSYRKLIVTITF